MNNLRQKLRRYLTLVALFVGLILGIIGGSVYILILWSSMGLLIGTLSGSRRLAVLNGSIYGFIVAFVFMMRGYQGTASLVSRIPFFAVLGIFGALCGLLLSITGYFVISKVINRASQ